MPVCGEELLFSKQDDFSGQTKIKEVD